MALWTAQRIARGLFTDVELVQVFLVAIATCKNAGNEPLAKFNDALDGIVAQRYHYRPAYLRRAPPARRAALAASLATQGQCDELTRDALVLFHFGERSRLMGSFLATAGIPNTNGTVDTNNGVPKLSPESAATAVAHVLQTYSPRHVRQYLAVAGLVMEDWRQQLWSELDTSLSTEPESGPSAGTAVHAQTQAEAGKQTRPPPESSERFTTLDDMLILAVINTVSEAEGALSSEQLGDAIEEVINLNSARHKSYFHRGYLKALARLDFETQFLERNTERLGWLLAGRVLGHARRGEQKAIAELFAANRSEFLEAIREPHDASGLFVPELFRALWSEGQRASALETLSPAIVAKTLPKRAGDIHSTFYGLLVATAEELFFTQNTGMARQLLTVLERTVELRKEFGQAHPQEVFRLARRSAQCTRAEGHYALAIKRFEDILSNLDKSQQFTMHADIGLARGSLRWLSEVRLPVLVEDATNLAGALSAGRQDFLSAVGPDAPSATATYCLGVLYLLEKNHEKAAGYLSSAYSAMQVDARLYRTLGVLPRTEMYFGLAILLNADEPQFLHAAQLIDDAVLSAPKEIWPTWLLSDAVGMAIAGPTIHRAPLVSALIRASPSLLKEVVRGSLDHADEFSAEFEQLVQSNVSRGTQVPDERLDFLEWLVSRYVAESRSVEAGVALDLMEQMAESDQRSRGRLIEYLRNPSARWTAVWDAREAREVRARLLLRDGAREEAVNELRTIFYELMAGGRREEAGDVLAYVKSLGLDTDIRSDMESWFEASASAEFAEAGFGVDPLETYQGIHGPLKLLFIGGNEQQAAYEPWLREELARTCPGMNVQFMFTGWSSQFSGLLDDVRRMAPDLDAFVIMRFVRTEFGRSVRKIANDSEIQWRACTGHGRDSLLKAIQRAARDVALSKLGH